MAAMSAPAPGGSVIGAAKPAGDRASTAGGATPSSATARPTSPGGRPQPSEFTALAGLVDVHFDFDRYDIRPDAARVLEANARALRARGTAAVLVEGHCDERGTIEYNLALGERRARAAMNALVAHGVDVRRITVVSYGEERPQCREKSEACWARNRRAHFQVKER